MRDGSACAHGHAYARMDTCVRAWARACNQGQVRVRMVTYAWSRVAEERLVRDQDALGVTGRARRVHKNRRVGQLPRRRLARRLGTRLFERAHCVQLDASRLESGGSVGGRCMDGHYVFETRQLGRDLGDDLDTMPGGLDGHANRTRCGSGGVHARMAAQAVAGKWVRGWGGTGRSLESATTVVQRD